MGGEGKIHALGRRLVVDGQVEEASGRRNLQLDAVEPVAVGWAGHRANVIGKALDDPEGHLDDAGGRGAPVEGNFR